MHFCWIDVETTGLSEIYNDVVQLACIPVVNGNAQEAFNEFCQPKNWDKIDSGAVAVHGITRDMMTSFQSPDVMLDKFISYLKSFNTKFIIAGYNVDFDKKFLGSLFTKCGRSDDFLELFEINVHDTYRRAKKIKGKLHTENLKLETLANHFNISITAHDAISDIKATIRVDEELGKILGEEALAAQNSSISRDPSITFREPAQLHLHSMFDMTESVPRVEEWEEWAIKNGVPGFSIVDHGSAISLYHMRSSQRDVTRIPGCGLYFKHEGELCPFNAWAVTEEGYFNLIYLSSLGFDNVHVDDGVDRPVLPIDKIKANMKGLVFGSGTLNGSIGHAVLRGDLVAAENIFSTYVDIFGDQLLVEFCPVSVTRSYSLAYGFQHVERNDVVEDGDWNKAYNRFMFVMMKEHGLRGVPVSAAHFIEKKDKIVQDVIAKNSYKSGKYYVESYHARLANDIYWELKEQLGDQLTPTIFSEWIDNTIKISDQAQSIDIKFDYHLPRIDIPAHITAQTDNYNRQTLLYTIELCKKHGRWKDDPVYVERLKREIDVIMNNEAVNFLPYFLLYEDICTFARSRGILQNIGRGSAGGCLLSYYLKIIHVDPIKNNLPFERFLSHARIRAKSFPDIDCDFGDRSEILKYLQEKYGAGFAQIGTLHTMKTKNAIKDAMWALYGKNRRDPNVEAVCAHIPDSPQGVKEYDFLYGFTNKEGEYTPGIVETTPEVAAFFKQFPSVEKLVKRLIGLVRGIGRHASAFVISTLDISRQRLPTMQMYDRHIDAMIAVTQYEAAMVEKCGLVKADILGVTTIQAVSDCIQLINKRHNRNLLIEDDNGVAEIYRLPEDEGVYADFYNKKTDSSFQFNTPLIKGYIQQFCPTEREHLAIMTALCRPGALDAPFTNDEISEEDGVTAAQYYMDVRSGKRNLSFLHDDLKEYIPSGVFIYQEEIMAFLVGFAGYTLEESDRIRGAIAKKKADVMMDTFNRIRIAAEKRGWTRQQADIVCNQIQAFARYSFNRSHSRCYGELGYITMYLKHHYRLEWWASILNNTKSEDRRRHYIALLGDIIKPPSLKVVSDKFTVVDNHIVAPMSVLKRLGGVAFKQLVEAGPFTSLDDYIERVDHRKVNIGHFSALLRGRAADCLMRQDIPYAEARRQLMGKYMAKRKSRPFQEDMYKLDPLSVFIMERDTNTSFNKALLADPDLLSYIASKNDKLIVTNKKNAPLIYVDTPILLNSVVADILVQRQHRDPVAMMLLFQGSRMKKVKSKRTGKTYDLLEVSTSDGFTEVECVSWDIKKALNLPKNSVILVKGSIKEGWREKISFTATEIIPIIKGE